MGSTCPDKIAANNCTVRFFYMITSENSVVVRFAPSPTGHLHIGGLRTALFNWLFARHYDGTYLLRIEDTDTERSTPEYTQSILASLRWVGIESDKPIVIQSERVAVHQQMLEDLIARGKAYRCFCAPDDHIKRYKAATGQDDLFIKYDRYCRNHVVTDLDKDKPYVVRFKLPDDRVEVTFDDIIRGRVTFALDQLDDFIIARPCGGPMYNFVVIADDVFMHITHIIRGEEHISNTPKQILLYEAFGFAIPQFAHLPMILGPNGDKLSKRDGAVSVLEYKQNGYLPEAIITYLARLGWAHGDQEIFTKEELIRYFSLDNVGKKGAIFDSNKLDWVNSVYMRQMSNELLLTHMSADVMPTLPEQLSAWDANTIYHGIGLYKERVKTLKELAYELILVHNGPDTFNADDMRQWVNSDTRKYVEAFIEKLEMLNLFTVDLIKNVVQELCREFGIKLTQLAQPLRIALIGKSSGPGAFELAALIGKQGTIERLRVLLQTI
jgi:glutamyl-tRNA synthetase